MKRVAIIAALSIGFATAAFADPLEGMWRTAPDDNGEFGLIEVAPCGDALCGTLIRAFDSSGAEKASANIGRQIISETRPRGDGAYRGKIYAPDRDKTYSSRLRLNRDTLSVSGCVFGICRDGGTWQRAN